MNLIKKNMKGFTLVELLIVIGILAVLAAVVIVAINPAQNLAKTRDAGRLTTVDQLGHALEARYTTAATGKYIDNDDTCAGGASPGTTWANCLTAASGGSGEINTVPALVTNTLTAVCAGPASSTVGVQNGWCYKATNNTGAGPVIVYSRLEAQANIAKCTTPATDLAYALYSSDAGKSGVVCVTALAGEAGLPLTSVQFK